MSGVVPKRQSQALYTCTSFRSDITSLNIVGLKSDD